MDCCDGGDEARMDRCDYDVIERRQCCGAMLPQQLHRHSSDTTMTDDGGDSMLENLDYPRFHRHHCYSYLPIRWLIAETENSSAVNPSKAKLVCVA